VDHVLALKLSIEAPNHVLAAVRATFMVGAVIDRTSDAVRLESVELTGSRKARAALDEFMERLTAPDPESGS
jgi:hypothetical protein